jgi:hypothetical protein
VDPGDDLRRRDDCDEGNHSAAGIHTYSK